jgi:5-methylthioadenosine/S-adenosylhomocysteine deaminase
MDPQQPVIEHGAVAIADGAIVAVGPAAQIMATYRARRVLPGQGQALMPGLINAHTHLAMALFRGLADDLTLSDWLQNHIFPAEAAFVTPKFVRVGVELACWEMIRGGTTTFVDMYFYPDAEASVIDQCGLRGVIAPSAIDFPSPGSTGWDDSFAAAVDFAERWKGRNPRILPALGVHAPYTVSPEHLQQARDAALRLGVPISIHVAETESEVDDVLARYGNRPVNHLNSLDVFAAQTIAAKPVHVQMHACQIWRNDEHSSRTLGPGRAGLSHRARWRVFRRDFPRIHALAWGSGRHGNYGLRVWRWTLCAAAGSAGR